MMRHPLSYTLFPYTTLFRSEEDNTIVVFTTDNGTEVFTWPDGGQTPFAQSKGTIMEAAFHDRSLGLRERRLTAIGPREDFSPVVRGEDDDRVVLLRSEERRVGKEGIAQGVPHHSKKIIAIRK